MALGFDVETLNLLGKMISKLERFNLENSSPENAAPSRYQG